MPAASAVCDVAVPGPPRRPSISPRVSLNSLFRCSGSVPEALDVELE